MNHSSVLPFHGSGPATAPLFSERTTLTTVSRTPRPRMNEPIVEIRFRAPARAVRVLVDAPRHPVQAERVLDEERHVEADEHEPERDACPGSRTSIRPGHLREPVVDRRRRSRRPRRRSARSAGGRRRSRCRQLPVDREDGEEDAGDAADQERADEADGEQQRRPELDRPAPQRRDPVEDLDARRDRDHERESMKKASTTVAHRRREHVVRPHEQRRGTRWPPSRRRSPCSRRSACGRRPAGPRR